RPHELGVVEQLLNHADVLAAHRTVDDRRPRALGHRARRPDADGAVDDRQARLETVDVAIGLSDEVLDLERIADVHDVDVLDRLGQGRDVEPHRAAAAAYQLEDRAPDFAEPDDEDGLGATHGRDPCAISIASMSGLAARVERTTVATTRSC